MNTISYKKVFCTKCYRKLCHREPITLDGDETYILSINHKGLEIRTFDAVITCPKCHSRYRVTGFDGIIDRVTNTYADIS